MVGPRRDDSESVQSILETYFRQINETPLLTADEERTLAYRIQAGDAAARDLMVRANLRLVVNIARSYHRGGLGLEDLIAEGNLGLLRAAEAFDPDMNTRFSTYASYWIRQSIKRGLVNTAKTIRLPNYVVELLADWRRATAALQDELGRPPTEEETAARIGLPRKKLRIVKKALRIHSATPQPDMTEGGPSIEELATESQAAAPESALFHADELRQVLGLLDQMDPREATVLRLRYGLGGKEPMTLKEVGERLGLTRERVRQIESEALAKLGDQLKDE
jgi:RNA polymerase primary sigma factor